MEFEWDDAKATANERKHGVSFTEAATTFADPLAAIFPDPDHSNGRRAKSRSAIPSVSDC